MPEENLNNFDIKQAVELIRWEIEAIRTTVQPAVLDSVYQKMTELVQAYRSNDISVIPERALFAKEIIRDWEPGWIDRWDNELPVIMGMIENDDNDGAYKKIRHLSNDLPEVRILK